MCNVCVCVCFFVNPPVRQSISLMRFLGSLRSTHFRPPGGSSGIACVQISGKVSELYFCLTRHNCFSVDCFYASREILFQCISALQVAPVFLLCKVGAKHVNMWTIFLLSPFHSQLEGARVGGGDGFQQTKHYIPYKFQPFSLSK